MHSLVLWACVIERWDLVNPSAQLRAVGSMLDVGRWRVQNLLTAPVYHTLLFVKYVLVFAD